MSNKQPETFLAQWRELRKAVNRLFNVMFMPTLTATANRITKLLKAIEKLAQHARH